eukprot:UN28950
MFVQCMQEYLYPCYLAGVNARFSTVTTGMQVKVWGYSQHLFKITKEVIGKLLTENFSESKFNVMKEVNLRGMKNRYFDL